MGECALQRKNYIPRLNRLLLVGLLLGCFPALAAPKLPMPHHTRPFAKKLSLREAILLALRNSPDIENAQLQRVLDKFALETANYQFQPHYTLSGNAYYQNGAKPFYTVTPGVTYQTPIGTSLSASYTNNIITGNSGSGTFSITQPLLKGAGINVVEASLLDAKDQAVVAKINYKKSVVGVVVSVINGYRSLIEDQNNLAAQQRTLKETAQTLKNDRLQVKSGKMAPSDLLEQKSSYASTQLAFEQQKNAMQTSYQNFIESLGLDPSVKLKIDTQMPDYTNFKVMPLKKAIATALANNSGYLTAVIGMRSLKRAIAVAKNNDEWDLDVTASKTIGSSQTIWDAANLSTFNQFIKPDVSVSLNVPIDDMQNKQSIVQAKIALQEAQVSLKKQKLQLISQVTTAVQNLRSQKEEIKFAKENVNLQQQTYQAAKIKNQYGKATTFELNQQRNQTLSAQMSLISSKITFANTITSFYQTLGVTLKKWGIKLKD